MKLLKFQQSTVLLHEVALTYAVRTYCGDRMCHSTALGFVHETTGLLGVSVLNNQRVVLRKQRLLYRDYHTMDRPDALSV